MVYVANAQLYLRSMAISSATPIQGPTSSRGPNPVFSPDGRSIAFWSPDETIKRIAIDGGGAVTICPAERPFWMSWGDGGILFGQGRRASCTYPERRKTGSAVESRTPARLAQSRKCCLMASTSCSRSRPVIARSLGCGENRRAVAGVERTKTMIDGGSDARYLPTGHIVYARRRDIVCRSVRSRRLEVPGGPCPWSKA